MSLFDLVVLLLLFISKLLFFITIHFKKGVCIMPIIIGNMKALNLQYAELWFIMRSMDWYYKKKEKKPSKRFTLYSDEIIEANYRFLMHPNVKIISDLAPSQDLFTWYMLQRNKGQWNQEAFDKTYVPAFIRDLSTQQDSKDRLNQLWYEDKNGKTILLVCACQEENMCHRSIIAGVLHGVGVNVTSTFGTDISCYDKYYQMYRDAEKKYN